MTRLLVNIETREFKLNDYNRIKVLYDPSAEELGLGCVDILKKREIKY